MICTNDHSLPVDLARDREHFDAEGRGSDDYDEDEKPLNCNRNFCHLCRIRIWCAQADVNPQ